MIAIVARGVVSPLGEGEQAFGTLEVGAPETSRVVRDEELAAAGLAKPFAARARLVVPEGVDRATALLEHAFTACARELDDSLLGWRGLRVGAAIGTSSGGMRSFEALLDAPGPASTASALAATYIGPLVQAARPVAFEPVSLVLGACASSTLAIGLARAWLDEDRCDVVLAGGFDAVSVFVAAGFESLRATCGPRGPQPFRERRDGLALGEAAAILALVREPEARRVARVHGWITGFGASCDAAHLTAPDREGIGLARAAKAAVHDAGSPAIELVSAHGTATAQNDAAEAGAIRAVLGASTADVPVYSLKGAVGHTLGAAGSLEVLSAAHAMGRGVAPASVGEGPSAGDLRVLDRAVASSAQTALKLSSAFGGANAAVVLHAAEPVLSRGARPYGRRAFAFVSRAVVATAVDAEPARLAERTGYGSDRIGRADELVRLTIAATAALEDAHGGRGSLRGAGVLVGHGLATLETNAKFWARIRAAGAARAEPRRFPYTSPNAVAGECAVAFGLTGPAFAVGGGPHGGIEALGVAADLVRSGAADRIVVVAVDEVGDGTARLGVSGTDAEYPRSAAVALLVSAAGGPARIESCTVRLEARTRTPLALGSLAAHPALLPLVSGKPDQLQVELSWGGFAKATLFWLK
ncbi:MAG: 3-oxoacyl-[acyl-carrier-protein] synthase [Labilithrix sp.]|nr:3-oxoacyl-[acyl-carrier-protein] synthase [Labilithrix sp.]